MGMLSDQELEDLVPAWRVIYHSAYRWVGCNSARMYKYDVKKAAWRDDRFAAIKTDYERRGRDPSNLRLAT